MEERTVSLILSLDLEGLCTVLFALLVICQNPKKNMPKLASWPERRMRDMGGQSCPG